MRRVVCFVLVLEKNLCFRNVKNVEAEVKIFYNLLINVRV